MAKRWATWVGLFAILLVGLVYYAGAQDAFRPTAQSRRAVLPAPSPVMPLADDEEQEPPPAATADEPGASRPTGQSPNAKLPAPSALMPAAATGGQGAPTDPAAQSPPALLPAPSALEPPPGTRVKTAPQPAPVFTPAPIAPASPRRFSLRGMLMSIQGSAPQVPVAQAGEGEKKGEAQPPPTQPTTPTQPTQPTQPTTPTPSPSGFLGLPSVSGSSTSTPDAAATTAQAAPGMAASNVSGQSAIPSSGVGNLLANSASAGGVVVQKRSPVVGDPRIDGLHFGQIATYADGGYWFPARVDLDTVVSKVNSNNVSDILVIRGPFSVRFGPGFAFLDITSLATPRSTTGEFIANGGSNLTYRSNGQGLQGQQAVWGGNANWGFRLTYDVNVSGDYVTGNGTKMPSSYNNQFTNFAYGVDLGNNQTLETRYLHVLQSNVLIPGLLTDINKLTSDAFTARYTVKDGTWFDKVTVDTWVNNTTFNGDSSNTQTRAQIPQLDNIFPSDLSAQNALINATFNPVRLDITTSGHALSYGAREITFWGDAKGPALAVGVDTRVFRNNYNEYDAFDLSVLPGTTLPPNLGIPNSQQLDAGAFADTALPVGEALIFKAGGRFDYVNTQFLNFGTNTDALAYISQVGEPIGRHFLLGAAYATGQWKLSDAWTAQIGYGVAERPPTLTELYTGGAFLGLIQSGFNSIYGSPGLRPEQMQNLNANLTAKYDKFRAGFNPFYAFVRNYITYNNLGPFTVSNILAPTVGPFVGTTPIDRLQFMNTGLATLYGFNVYSEWDAQPWLTPFFTLNFVEGWDQTRNLALPGIPPLQSLLGLRFHAADANPRWGVEYAARMVATQNLFASYLGEQRTGGFVVHYIRAYWLPRDNVQLLAGIENVGNLQYREHLDLRTGNGVFQPGISVYTGVRISY